VSSNYTHVVRDLLDAGINVLAQLVATEREDGADLAPRMRETERRGAKLALLAPYRARGMFQPFPFGTDLTREEKGLRQALQTLKRVVARKRLRLLPASQLRKVAMPPPSARPYLERMGLDAPRTLKERFLRRIVVYALASTDAI
jgi:hypothetical protein